MVATPSGEALKTPAQGETKVEGQPQVSLLEQIAKETGRTFKDEKDFVGFVKEFNSKIGDQAIAETRKKAESYDSVLKLLSKEYNQPENIVDAYLREQTKNPVSVPQSQTPTSTDPFLKSRLDNLESEIKNTRLEAEKNLLTSKYPEASPYLNDIVALALARGESPLRTFETSAYKELVDSKKTQPAGQSIVQPTSRKGISEDILSKFKPRAGKLSDSEMHSLVRETLGET